MASGYDVTIKLCKHHVIERVMRAVDAIYVLNVRTYVFCSCYSVISAVSQAYSSAALHLSIHSL